MTPSQRQLRAALDRAYLADLRDRVLKASCPKCGAPRGKPCIHMSGPRLHGPMARYHYARSDEANRLGYVRGPRYWQSRRS